MKRTGFKNKLIASTLAALTIASTGAMAVTSASATTTDINSFIRNSKANNVITSTDNYNYKPVINKKRGVISENSVDKEVFVTTTKKVKNNGTIQIKTIPGVGEEGNTDYVYPGNIFMIEDTGDNKTNISEAEFNIISDIAKRSGGSFIINDDSDSEFDIKDMSNKKTAISRTCDEIQDSLYEYAADKECLSGDYVIHIATASSPEQLSAKLGMSEGAIKSQIDADKWDDIRAGRKQLTAVSVQQIFATVEFKNDLSDPSKLFSDKATVTDINKMIRDNKSNGMLITKVNYGRQYLMTAEIDLRNTAKEQHVDLTGAIQKRFNDNKNYSKSQENALKHAKISVSEIGLNSIEWEENQTISNINSFLDYLDNNKVFSADSEETLVPVSYEAKNLAGTLPDVTLNIKADEYEFTGISADKIKNLSFDDEGDGKNYHRNFWTYGIDLEKFSTTGEIVEKRYEINRDVRNIDIPAYQCVFGVQFNLDGGVKNDNGNAMIYTKKDGTTRLYQNSGFRYSDDNNNSVSKRRIEFSNMSLIIGKTHRSVGYNRNYIEPTFYSRDNDKMYSDLTKSAFHSNAGNKSGSGWTECWAEFSYDNTLDIDGNGLYLNNREVNNL